MTAHYIRQSQGYAMSKTFQINKQSPDLIGRLFQSKHNARLFALPPEKIIYHL